MLTDFCVLFGYLSPLAEMTATLRGSVDDAASTLQATYRSALMDAGPNDAVDGTGSV